MMPSRPWFFIYFEVAHDIYEETDTFPNDLVDVKWLTL